MSLKVVVFKAPSDSEDEKDVYQEILEEAGFEVYMIPVLEFEFVELEKLLSKLKTPNEYSGIIFTSPRTVAAVQLATQSKTEEILKEWKNNKSYVVGESTARLTEELGIDTHGKEAGNSNALADVISQGKWFKPFLYPTGSLTQPTFKMKLKQAGIETDNIIIYSTKAHSKLQGNVKQLVNKLSKDQVIFVYFSPSGVKFTLPILKEVNYALDHVKFVAIGGTTEVCLQEHGLHVAKTAAKPNPEELLKAIKYVQSNS